MKILKAKKKIRKKNKEQSPHPSISSSPHSKEVGGRNGPEPTRFGDWENKGRCVDF